ncbi:putative P450 monooxygenase [Zymoseptoria tritici IPO323]|nr:putative P450 monooxygenase [Zymoseptoria tritici IPO323]EGP89995.1 putative P450 monooxygenase [Zymoseptoria tritici IPO323]
MLGDHERYGDTYAQWGGSVYTVITRDPRNIRAMLSRQFKSFEIGSGRHGCVRPLLGDGIFTQDGSKWEASRKLLAPMIQRPTLPELNLVERHFQLLRNAMTSGLVSDRGPLVSPVAVNMKDLLLDLSLKLTTEFLLGKDLDSKMAPASSTQWTDDFAAEFNVAFKWISKRERLKAFYWLIDSVQFRKSCDVAQRLVDEAVCHAQELRKSRKLSGESYVALDSLLHQEGDHETVRDQFMNLLLAGRDTSGALLCWAFYALSREPQVLIKMRKEIESMVGTDGRAPTKSELNSMTILDQFVTETLRLFPPIPLNGRFSTEDTFLPHGGGEDGEAPILIPKRTLIAFSTFATHRSEDLYGRDASRFNIGRWEDHTKEQRMVDWSYHPFLGGPRKCLGERFAITEAKYLICRALQHFQEIIPIDEDGNTLAFRSDGAWVDDVKYHVGLTMMPDAGLWLRFVPAF